MNVARRALGKLTASTSVLWHRKPAVSTERIEQLADTFRHRISELRSDPILNVGADDLWLKFCYRLEKHAEYDDPMGFLRWPVIESTMSVIASYLDLELDYVRSHPTYGSLWRSGLRETRVGRPIPYWRHPWTSGNTIHQTYHLCRFSDATQVRLENTRFAFEFGGGYGNFCRLLFALGFKGQYVIFDLPHFSALQRFYLDAVGLAADATATPGRCGVTCVSRPDEANRILQNADLTDSLFIGTWSLSETPLGSRDWIEKHLVRFSHILLAYQNEFCGTDNSDYFMRAWRRLQASHACRVEDIAHIPGNNYLFASGANHPAERGDRHPGRGLLT
jgi:hypothetical protein